jgi:hypothetical protein
VDLILLEEEGVRGNTEVVPHANEEIDRNPALPKLGLSQVVRRDIGTHAELSLGQAGICPRFLKVCADTCAPEVLLVLYSRLICLRRGAFQRYASRSHSGGTIIDCPPHTLHRGIGAIPPGGKKRTQGRVASGMSTSGRSYPQLKFRFS